MTAPTKNFTAPSDTQIDEDSPIDETLLTQLRDCLIHLEEWIGADYTAAQNHNHDGVNSASLGSAADDGIRNGSFETNDLQGWDQVAYTGGTLTAGTSSAMDGSYAAAITSTILANGGGSLTTGQYFPVSGGQYRQFRMMIRGSVSGISSEANVIWYNAAQNQISEDSLYLTAATPTSTNGRQVIRRVAAPALARFCRIELVGGVPTLGTAVGTVYFDGVNVEAPAWQGVHLKYETTGDVDVEIWGDIFVTLYGAGGGGLQGLGKYAGAAGGVASGFILYQGESASVGAGGVYPSGVGGTTALGSLIYATGGDGGSGAPPAFEGVGYGGNNGTIGPGSGFSMQDGSGGSGGFLAGTAGEAGSISVSY